jgi:hypothetical protein
MPMDAAFTRYSSASSSPNAARCTARHGVGSYAEPPTTECDATGKEEGRTPVPSRVRRELDVPPLVRHPGEDEPEADHGSSQSCTSRNSGMLFAHEDGGQGGGGGRGRRNATSLRRVGSGVNEREASA